MAARLASRPRSQRRGPGQKPGTQIRFRHVTSRWGSRGLLPGATRRGQLGLGVGCPPRVGGGGHRRTTGAYRARGRPHRQALSILGMSCTPITMPQTFIFITIIIQKIKRNKYVSRSNTCIHKYLKIQIYGSQTLSYLLLSTNRRVSWSDTIPSGKDADDLGRV